MDPFGATSKRVLAGDAAILAGLFVLIALRARPEFQLDEDRYVDCADRLLRATYADPITKFLWNGPGYPLLLTPFRLFGAPLILAKLVNAFFLLGALAYLRKTLRLYLPDLAAVRLSYAAFAYLAWFGLPWLHLLMTESAAAFFASGYLHHFCASGASGFPRRQLFLAAMHAAALALTKVFFGYALAAQIALGLLGLALRWRAAGRGAAVAALALVFCLPYLVYTFRLTGRIFYWSNAGGSELYTLTLPERHLLGDVIPMEQVPLHPEFFPSTAALLASLPEGDEVKRDDAFRRAARENLKRHPAKVFRNWRANVNRLVFDYPFSRFPSSHSRQGTGNLGFVFAPIWFATALCAIPAWRRRRLFAQEFSWMLGFAAISLAGLSLLSAYARFVYPLLPILLCFIALNLERVVTVRLRGG